ncbi:MAG: PilW family protein [Halioglobus sp.]|nr:PilW family protein [Halioglobus sp.]
MRQGLRQRQKGISAIELMIGMLLGLILIGGAISIFLASKRSYTEVEQISALTENAQFAQRLLNNALLHAGFFGEVQSNRIELDDDLTAIPGAVDCAGDAAAYDLQNYLFAAVADADGDALGCITDAVPGSHVLVIKSVAPSPFTDGPRDNPDPDVETHGDGEIDTPTALSATQTYVMTNDTVGIMFDGADSAPSILTGGDVPGGVAWAYRYEVYYVRDDDIPQLSRKVLAFVAGGMTIVTEDLVEGVEDMRLRFGLDGAGSGDGEVDTYTAVGDMGSNWGQVESVEVSVLVRSANEDPNYSNPKSYVMPGGNVTPADSFRRMLITNSMSLRNPKLMIRGNAA